jgi:hypothetical protein
MVRPGRSGGGDDFGELLGLHFDQRGGGDGLDLRHDEVGLFLFDQGPQCSPIGHVDHMRAMRDLMAGSVGVAIDGNHLDAESLQGDDHFLAELSGAQQHDAQRAGGQRGSDLHGAFLELGATQSMRHRRRRQALPPR